MREAGSGQSAHRVGSLVQSSEMMAASRQGSGPPEPSPLLSPPPWPCILVRSRSTVAAESIDHATAHVAPLDPLLPRAVSSLRRAPGCGKTFAGLGEDEELISCMQPVSANQRGPPFPPAASVILWQSQANWPNVCLENGNDNYIYHHSPGFEMVTMF